ncbi:MAG: metallophosphoesterase [Thermaerobacter sp.]|nr:metallophosphoesterase [Thermaerobacter sp.]
MKWFQKRPAGKSLKIFFATDIHGSDRCFRKFINAAEFYGANVLILGGDITGKVVVPITKTSGGLYRATVHHQLQEVSERELPQLFKEIRSNGFYYYVTTRDEMEFLSQHPAAREEMFHRVIKDSLAAWFELAEERLKGTGVQVFVSPGNDDDDSVVSAINAGPFVVNPDETVREIAEGVWMLSFGWSNRTPWDSPRELDDNAIGQRLEHLVRQMPGFEHAIFNIHVPPYNTPLDKAPQLTADLKPVVEAGEVQMTSVGSVAVRDFILKYQPLLGLHGHIHESAGITKLGRTTCINPGSEYSDGTLKGALVTIDMAKGSVMRQLIAG